jgi:hypothetical protein
MKMTDMDSIQMDMVVNYPIFSLLLDMVNFPHLMARPHTQKEEFTDTTGIKINMITVYLVVLRLDQCIMVIYSIFIECLSIKC